MKKFLITLLAFLLILSMAGCSAKEKAAEKVTEEILEDAGVDADIDGDKVVIKGEDGQELTIGEGEWPSSDLAKNIPEFKGGTIVSVMESNDSLFIMIEDISDEDFTAYLGEIKETFTGENYEMNTDTSMIYTAVNDSNISVMLTYEKDTGLSITVSQAEPEVD